jgi:hypothetical protein
MGLASEGRLARTWAGVEVKVAKMLKSVFWRRW